MGLQFECVLEVELLLMGPLLAPYSHPPEWPKWPELVAQNAQVKKEAC